MRRGPLGGTGTGSGRTGSGAVAAVINDRFELVIWGSVTPKGRSHLAGRLPDKRMLANLVRMLGKGER